MRLHKHEFSLGRGAPVLVLLVIPVPVLIFLVVPVSMAVTVLVPTAPVPVAPSQNAARKPHMGIEDSLSGLLYIHNISG